MTATTAFDAVIARDNEALFASPAATGATYVPQGPDPAPASKAVRVIQEPLGGNDDPRGASMPQRHINRVLMRISDLPEGRAEAEYMDLLMAGGKEWTVLGEVGREGGVIEFYAEHDMRAAFGR